MLKILVSELFHVLKIIENLRAFVYVDYIYDYLSQ